MGQSELEQARAALLSGEPRAGIGTLGEKTLHAVLKEYLEPRREYQEVSFGPYVADICREEEILELQTGSFDRLRGKLDYFLPRTRVTVVYPVAAVKWLVWLDEDGRPSRRRKSPRRGSPCEIFPELYKIKPQLSHPNLRLRILLLELEEHRLQNGWGGLGHRNASRFDRVPLALSEEIRIESREDYSRLLPAALPTPFTVRDFARAGRISSAAASVALNVLFSLETVTRVGKQGNAWLYQPSLPKGEMR